MEQITQAQLNSALIKTDAPLQRRLSSEDGLTLTAILERAQRRWPNQDSSESMEEYLADYEQLALKYSLLKVEAALDRLRIKPGQAFFPKPDEISEEIVYKRECNIYAADKAAYEIYQREMKALALKYKTNPAEKAWRIKHFGYDIHDSSSSSNAQNHQTPFPLTEARRSAGTGRQ